MKKDVNELKKMFFDLLKNPGMASHSVNFNNDMPLQNEMATPAGNGYIQSSSPYILNSNNNNNNNHIHQHEEVEESLSIVDKEKELIIKALKKHRGKRRDASLDLGISERTLYRKLKEYDIEDL